MKAVNLIPPDQRRGAGGIAGRSGGIMYVVVGGLAVVVGLGILYAFAVKSVADRKGQLAALTEQTNAVQAQAATLSPYVQIEQLRERGVGGVVGLATTRFDWPDAMKQLAYALPSDVTLTGLSGSVAGPAVSTASTPTTTSTTGGAGFTLAGCASSQAEVATVLTQLEQVPGVTSVSLQSATKQGKAANAGKPVARRKALARTGQCPLVSFNADVSYSETYTVPEQRLPSNTTPSKQASARKPAATDEANTVAAKHAAPGQPASGSGRGGAAVQGAAATAAQVTR
jgi:Tfp pilus assembly protein PilN